MNVQPYDFTRPPRLPGEWQTRLTQWCRMALSVASPAWARLPTPLEPSLLEVDVRYASQALAGVQEGHLGYRVLLANQRVISLLAIPRRVMLFLVSVLLGDKVDATLDRDLTLVEEKLGEYFLIHYCLNPFRETWPPGPDGSWRLEPREPHLKCNRTFSASDVLVVFRWQVRGPWGDSIGYWLFPKIGLLEELGAESATPARSGSNRPEDIVTQAPLELKIVLGSAELTLSDLFGLKVGDVILLDQSCAENVAAHAGGRELFRGKVGRIGAWKAFQVESYAEA